MERYNRRNELDKIIKELDKEGRWHLPEGSWDIKDDGTFTFLDFGNKSIETLTIMINKLTLELGFAKAELEKKRQEY